MEKKRPFSKLKRTIDGLFDPVLKMEFCCISFPVKGEWGTHNAVPRFYLKMDKEIIWDFPGDFEIRKAPFYFWANNNHISDLIRDYIDTPIDRLIEKTFENDKAGFVIQNMGEFGENIIEIDYNLVSLFIAADRRLGREKLLKWARKQNNPKVDYTLVHRFGGI